MKRLQLGVIGHGWVVNNCYAPVLRGSDSPFSLRAVADPSSGARLHAAGLWPDAKIVEFPAALPFDELDAVLVASPNAEHLEQACDLMDRGIACLIEKPVIRNLTDLDRLQARRRNTLLAPALACRHRPDVALWLDWTARSEPLAALDLLWLRHKGVPARAWHHVACDGWTGVFADLGSHLVDLAGAVLDWPSTVQPLVARTRLEARGAAAEWYAAGAAQAVELGTEDRVEAVFQAGGTRISVTVAWSDAEPGDIVSLVAHGKAGSVRLEGLLGFSTDRRVPHQIVERRDAKGTLIDRRAFPPGPGLHVEGFRAMIADFSAGISGGRRTDWRPLAFYGATGSALATVLRPEKT